MAESNRGLWVAAGLVLGLCLLYSACERISGTEPVADTAPPVPAKSVINDALQPVSGACNESSRLAERKGLVRPGSMSPDGAVLLTDSRWPSLPVDLQQFTAECLSHYLAGGQNRWVKKITFRSQASGVVYGTIDGDRYSVGE